MASIFITKLDFGVTQDELRDTFKKFGNVLKVTIVTDRETQKPKGFAFVEMSTAEEAQNAVDNMQEIYFNGRKAIVKIAEDRSDSKPKAVGNNQDRQRGSFNNREKAPFNKSNEYKSEYKNLDKEKRTDGKIVSSPEDISNELQNRKTVVTKKKEEPSSAGKPKVKKMEAYKKTNKRKNFLDFDDEDDYLY